MPGAAVPHQRADPHRLLKQAVATAPRLVLRRRRRKTCGTVLAGNDPFGNRYCCDACPVVAIAQRGDSVRQFGLTYRTKSDDYLPVDIAVLKFALPATKGVVLAHIVQTARNHVQHIFEKLEVHSKAE